MHSVRPQKKTLTCRAMGSLLKVTRVEQCSENRERQCETSLSSSLINNEMDSTTSRFRDLGIDEVCRRVSKENWNSNVPLGHRDSGTTKRKKGSRVRYKDDQELKPLRSLEQFSPSMRKYWFQRYLLFSKYDEGIQMDEEGWFSVTPESIAKHHAQRCGGGTIIDCFTGVGGNAIQFAKSCKRVTAIDVDPKKIEYAKNNARIYGVEDRIKFITGDTFLLAPTLRADVVFLSPPWGGLEYAKAKKFDLNMLKPRDGYYLFNVAKRISSKIVMFLPRNVDMNQLAELCLSCNPPWSLEVEKNFVNGSLKAITAYFTAPPYRRQAKQ